MSLVSNFIGEISSLQFGNKTNVTNSLDINDNTFSELLNKQMEVDGTEENNGINLNQLGMPAGIDIEPFDGIEDDYSKRNEASSQINNNVQEETTSSETITFFDSLLNSDSQDKNHSELFDFAKRQATNLYNQYSRSVVTDVNEFVQDIKSMI